MNTFQLSDIGVTTCFHAGATDSDVAHIPGTSSTNQISTKGVFQRFFKQLYFFLSKCFHPIFLCVYRKSTRHLCSFYLILSNLFISTYFVYLFFSIETSILTFILYRISNTIILYFFFKYVFYCSNNIEMVCSIFSSNVIDSCSVYEKYIIFSVRRIDKKY